MVAPSKGVQLNAGPRRATHERHPMRFEGVTDVFSGGIGVKIEIGSVGQAFRANTSEGAFHGNLVARLELVGPQEHHFPIVKLRKGRFLLHFHNG